MWQQERVEPQLYTLEIEFALIVGHMKDINWESASHSMVSNSYINKEWYGSRCRWYDKGKLYEDTGCEKNMVTVIK